MVLTPPRPPAGASPWPLFWLPWRSPPALSFSSDSRSIRSFTQQDRFESPSDDIEIEPDRPVGHIIFVELNPFSVTGVIPSRDLPHAADAWPNTLVGVERIPVADDLSVDDRPRPDKTHFPFQHIP